MTKPTLDYATHQQRSRRSTRWWEWAIVVGVIVLVIAILLPTGKSTSAYHSNWGRCLQNLKRLKIAMDLYAHDHHGAVPPDFATIAIALDSHNHLFVCESSSQTHSSATQPADIRADFAAGGHCSYILVDSPSPPRLNDVVIFEAAGNHDGDINVLFGDGRVERFDGAVLQSLLAQHASGSRPLRVNAKPTFP